jgi:hypothetical protein
MKIRWALFSSAILIGFLPSQGDLGRSRLGQGNISCGSWIENRRDDNPLAATRTAWVLGFITAFNQYGCLYRKLDSAIMVMKSAEDGRNEIRMHTYDETNRRGQPDRIIREIRNAGGRALIGLVGVQFNQFPRAVDLAQPFLAPGLPVCIGGFHVSGCIAMLPEMPQEAAKMREPRPIVAADDRGSRPSRSWGRS